MFSFFKIGREVIQEREILVIAEPCLPAGREPIDETKFHIINNRNHIFMNNQIFHRIWHIVRIPLAVILVLYVGLVIYRIPAAQERLKTQEVVKKIQAQKLTLADVMGQNLPPEPDSALNNSTVEGIDANGNGIRDDVELAIFKLHPDSARIRAAELQYAMALQMYLTEVFNPDTLIAVAQEDERASSCLADQLPRDDIGVYYRDLKEKKNEIKDMILNTEERRKRANQNTMLIKSFGSLEEAHCDVDPKALSN